MNQNCLIITRRRESGKEIKIERKRSKQIKTVRKKK
jgi:hypothetical protein